MIDTPEKLKERVWINEKANQLVCNACHDTLQHAADLRHVPFNNRHMRSMSGLIRILLHRAKCDTCGEYLHDRTQF